jgi:hypothetical protein
MVRDKGKEKALNLTEEMTVVHVRTSYLTHILYTHWIRSHSCIANR